MTINEYIKTIYKTYKIEKKDIRRIINNIFSFEEMKNDSLILSKSQIKKLDNDFLEIFQNKPEEYIYGFKYFLGTKIYVTPKVLIPRGETELFVQTVIDEVKVFFKKKDLKIIDIGTGSGCISIAISKQLNKDVSIIATDISKDSLDQAKINIQKNEINNIKLLETNIIDGISNQVDIIISNPPYIDKEDKDIQDSVKRFEPHQALFAKDNGLELIKKILKDSQKVINEKSLIAIEFGWTQKEAVEKIILSLYPKNIYYNFYKDYSNNWRFVIIKFGC